MQWHIHTHVLDFDVKLSLIFVLQLLIKPILLRRVTIKHPLEVNNIIIDAHSFGVFCIVHFHLALNFYLSIATNTAYVRSWYNLSYYVSRYGDRHRYVSHIMFTLLTRYTCFSLTLLHSDSVSPPDIPQLLTPAVSHNGTGATAGNSLSSSAEEQISPSFTDIIGLGE